MSSLDVTALRVFVRRATTVLLPAIATVALTSCGSEETTTTVTEAADGTPSSSVPSGATGATGAAGPETVLTETQAERFVRRHYRDLNRGHFRRAWRDFTGELESILGPYQSFVDGYAFTEGTYVDRAEAAMRDSRSAAVEVEFSSDDLDACGEHVEQRFAGSWTVELEDFGLSLTDVQIEKVAGGDPVREVSACSAPPPRPKPPRLRLRDIYGPSYVPDLPAAQETGFCATHDCIPNFDNGNGYIVQCEDGTWSHSGGIQGACSWHGGVRE